MSTSISALRMSAAAACMARGLTAEDADRVWGKLAGQAVPGTVGEIFDQLDAAIRQVQIERPLSGKIDSTPPRRGEIEA